jgi:maltose-binding protein MalE
MKKLLLVAALSLGSLTAFAQETESTEAQSTEATATQEEFTEISNDEVPNAIQEAISSKHEGATLSSAAINAEGVYKLEVTKEDGSTKTLYADAEGNFIDM